MNKPLLLDLFCGAGGCTRGYQLAGFRVVGVDLAASPRYVGDEFHQADAMEFITRYGKEFDAIHGSPPCQQYSCLKRFARKEYPMLIDPLRRLMIATGKPYIIENVIGAPLAGILLCGTMFGLRVYRHRLFESNLPLMSAGCHGHKFKVCRQGYRPKDDEYMTVAGNFGPLSIAKKAMGIEWMTRKELAQSIPPANTEYIGRQVIAML